jgi:hypothetical protein
MNKSVALRLFILIGFFFLFNKNFVAAQVITDSLPNKNLETKKLQTQPHSPKKATILSAVLPGAGQFYNKKYWKPPIIYAIGGTLGYIAFTNYKQYDTYRDIIIKRTATPDSIPFDDIYAALYTTDNLLVLQNGFRTNLEYAAVGLFLIYVLQIVDATVDAHLFYFDISDDLSLNIKPTIQPTRNQMYSGINLTLNFK